MEKFYDAEKALGKEEYRVEVYDFEIDWTVDQTDLGKYGGSWYVLSADGCSCWAGEWTVEAGPYEDLDGVRKYIHDEYGVQTSDYYEPFVEAWYSAIDTAASAV